MRQRIRSKIAGIRLCLSPEQFKKLNRMHKTSPEFKAAKKAHKSYSRNQYIIDKVFGE